MDHAEPNSISIYFADLPDPRVERTRLHNLLDILTIALLGIVCGAEGWDQMEEFGDGKLDWLRTFLPLANGIPCADTFRRVFGALDPKEFHACFQKWVQSLSQSLAGKVVAIDGKTLRGSYDTAAQQSPLHLVHAWAAQNQLLLGQLATEEKSNEITAIPMLLKLLDLKGAVVTIDAMGCQTKIAKAIVEQGADYVLALKGNQETLHQEVVDLFSDKKADVKAPLPYAQTVDGDHGRIETRRTYVTSDIDWFVDQSEWSKLHCFVMVESEREIGDKKTLERRYYISSLSANAERFSGIIRSHWSVENQLHWSLDVALGEDQSRVRKDHGPENLSLVRKMALMLLKRETTKKRGIRTKQYRACLDNDYLLSVLAAGLP